MIDNPVFDLIQSEGLQAALTRLKRVVMGVQNLKSRHAELVSASSEPSATKVEAEGWTLKQVQGDDFGKLAPSLDKFAAAMADDLNTSVALTAMEEVLTIKKVDPAQKLRAIAAMDVVLGLDLLNLTREDLRIRPKDTQISEEEIEDALERRKAARAEKDFATSDAIRDELTAKGVEVMDGDPLGWEWKLQ